jgi:hypothetical protein
VESTEYKILGIAYGGFNVLAEPKPGGDGGGERTARAVIVHCCHARGGQHDVAGTAHQEIGSLARSLGRFVEVAAL